MKARSVFELIKPIKKLIYRNDPHVLVKMPHGKYERHYYQINEKNELLIHGKNAEEEGTLYNPIVKGKPSYEDEGRFFLKYIWGDNFAYPIDEQKNFQDSVNIDVKIKTAYSIGFLNGRNNNPTGGRKALWEDPIIMAMIIVIVITLLNAFFVYTGFTDLGVTFFGGQT